MTYRRMHRWVARGSVRTRPPQNSDSGSDRYRQRRYRATLSARRHEPKTQIIIDPAKSNTLQQVSLCIGGCDARRLACTVCLPQIAAAAGDAIVQVQTREPLHERAVARERTEFDTAERRLEPKHAERFLLLK